MALQTGVSEELKARFKSYLEEEFRQIPPTKAAMEYRKQTLVEMLDRAQELSIRGIHDEQLIYKTVVDGLGDMGERLNAFEHREEKTKEVKNKLSVGAIVAIAVVAMLSIIYVIVGAAANLWHPTWLIIVGGAFISATILIVMAAAKLIKKKNYLPVRFMAIAIEVMLSVFAFLVLQLIFKVDGSWLIFLAMVALIFGVDTAIAFMIDSKKNSVAKWIELPIFVEVLFVMVYVILGISLDVLHHVASIWHPGWLLCLVGVALAIVEIIVFVVKKAQEKREEEKHRNAELNENEDEAYWTEWDD